jgi:hypothetical protein
MVRAASHNGPSNPTKVKKIAVLTLAALVAPGQAVTTLIDFSSSPATTGFVTFTLFSLAPDTADNFVAYTDRGGDAQRCSHFLQHRFGRGR